MVFECTPPGCNRFSYVFRRDYMNMLNIGMLFGNGNELGIGIDAQPDIDTTASISNTIRTAILTLFFNFSHSPAQF